MLPEALNQALSIAATHFQEAVIGWADANADELARTRNFPWRDRSKSPYEILIAEVLLKRTTATAASRIYLDFVSQFPTPLSLAVSSIEEIATAMETVGLQQQRARHLKLLGQYLVSIEGASVPNSLDRILKVPGLGDYSARAILSFGFGTPAAIVDSNVERVIRRVFNPQIPQNLARADLQEIANTLLSRGYHREYNFALLDLGALVCRYVRPKCPDCPLLQMCGYAEVKLKTNQPKTPPHAAHNPPCNG